MRERLVRRLVGYHPRKKMANPKNLNDRENPQGRLEK